MKAAGALLLLISAVLGVASIAVLFGPGWAGLATALLLAIFALGLLVEVPTK